MSEYQTKVQQHKVDAVDRYKERFGDAKDFVFTNFRGLNVKQITELRGKLAEQQAEYRVIKNSFAQLAFSQLGAPEKLGQFFEGPTAVAIARAESNALVKALFDFGRDTPLEIKGALIEGNVFDREQTEAYSKLPPRDELLAKLMGSMQAPLQNFVYVLNAVPQKLVRTLQAVADQKAGK